MGETTTVKRNSQAKDTFRRFIKNKAAVVGLIIISLLLFGAIFAGVITPYDFDKQDLTARFEMPSLSHPLGTDEFGRDLLTRILYGARISLFVGILSVSVGCLIGGTLGALAAYYGGRVDNSIMRFLDIWHSIPDLLLAISLASAMGPGIGNAIIAIGLTTIPSYARVVRASVMTTASLSFIGLGVQPPTPEWGSMLSKGRQYIRNYWHLVTFPGVFIMTTVISLNLLGDGLRDALDPRLKR